MPTARMPGRNTKRVGHGAQQVPGGDGRMWIMGPTPETLHSQGRLEGEDPTPGRNTLQACCEQVPAGVGPFSPWHQWLESTSRK